MNIDIKSEKVLEIFNFIISNTLLTEWLAIIVFLAMGLYLNRILKFKLKPTSIIQVMFEEVVIFFQNLSDDIFGNHKLAKTALLISLGFFFFILTPNWLGLLPGFGSLTIKEGEKFIPLFRSPNSDLNLPLMLALVSFSLSQYYGIKNLKLEYFKKFINFKGGIQFFVGLLELLSEFTKIISLSFRLFGNILAGEIIIFLALFFLPLFVPLPLLFFETFVGIIQAFIFSVLTIIFIKIAVTSH